MLFVSRWPRLKSLRATQTEDTYSASDHLPENMLVQQLLSWWCTWDIFYLFIGRIDSSFLFSHKEKNNPATFGVGGVSLASASQSRLLGWLIAFYILHFFYIFGRGALRWVQKKDMIAPRVNQQERVRKDMTVRSKKLLQQMDQSLDRQYSWTRRLACAGSDPPIMIPLRRASIEKLNTTQRNTTQHK